MNEFRAEPQRVNTAKDPCDSTRARSSQAEQSPNFAQALDHARNSENLYSQTAPARENIPAQQARASEAAPSKQKTTPQPPANDMGSRSDISARSDEIRTKLLDQKKQIDAVKKSKTDLDKTSQENLPPASALIDGNVATHPSDLKTSDPQSDMLAITLNKEANKTKATDSEEDSAMSMQAAILALLGGVNPMAESKRPESTLRELSTAKSGQGALGKMGLGKSDVPSDDKTIKNELANTALPGQINEQIDGGRSDNLGNSTSDNKAASLPMFKTQTDSIANSEKAQSEFASMMAAATSASQFAQASPLDATCPPIAMDTPANFAREAASFATRSLADGTTQAILRAAPEAMGPLTAEISMGAKTGEPHRLEMTLTLASANALALARDGLDGLQKNLAAAGLPQAQIELRLQEPVSASQPNSNSQSALHSGSQGQETPRRDSREARKDSREDSKLTPETAWRPTSLFDRSA